MLFSGRKLKKIRESKGISQEKLAKLIGVSSQAIYRWEKGDRKPKDFFVEKIAYSLGVAAGDFLSVVPMENTASIIKTREDFISLPVLSPEATACCGNGIPVSDITSKAEEYITFRRSEIGSYYDDMRPPFCINADGDSMKAWGIPHGSIVAVNPAEPVNSMDIALVCFYGRLALKKVRFKPDNSVELLSSDGEIISIKPEDNIPELFSIKGKAMGIYGKIKHGI